MEKWCRSGQPVGIQRGLEWACFLVANCIEKSYSEFGWHSFKSWAPNYWRVKNSWAQAASKDL